MYNNGKRSKDSPTSKSINHQLTIKQDKLNNPKKLTVPGSKGSTGKKEETTEKSAVSSSINSC